MGHGDTQAAFRQCCQVLQVVIDVAIAWEGTTLHTAELSAIGPVRQTPGCAASYRKRNTNPSADQATAHKNASDSAAAAYQDTKSGDRWGIAISAGHEVGPSHT